MSPLTIDSTVVAGFIRPGVANPDGRIDNASLVVGF